MVRISPGCHGTGSVEALSMGLALTPQAWNWFGKNITEGWQSREYSDSSLGGGGKQCLGCELWLTLHLGAFWDRCCGPKALP